MLHWSLLNRVKGVDTSCVNLQLHFARSEDNNFRIILVSLSTDVLEPRTSTGSRIFSSLGCVIHFLSVTSTYKRKNEGFATHLSSRECVKNNNSCLPVAVRGSKTSVLKFAIIRLGGCIEQQHNNKTFQNVQ